MADITSLNIKDLLIKTTNDIFDTMLSMNIEAADGKIAAIRDKNRIVGTVGFAGDVVGCMNIHFGETFARLIAGNMLGENPDDINNDDLLDVVGELSNMIGGDLKSRLCDSGIPCSLSIPTTMSGSDFIVESHGWSIHESVTFLSDDQVALVEVYAKTNNSI